MSRQKRNPAVIAKAVDDQNKLVTCISKEDDGESFAQVAALLEQGVDASAKDYNLSLYYASKNYFSPLHYAARNGAFQILDLLLKHNADPNARDRYEVTPLHLAAENGWQQCVKRLLEAGADVNARTRYLKDYHNQCILDSQLYNTQPAMVLHKVVKLPYAGGTTPLHLAAIQNREECVRLLMWEGADYNADDADGRTGLYLAAMRGLASCLMTQLNNAISLPILSIPTRKNDTALHECLRQGEAMAQCVMELVERGSDVSFQNADGDTPMHLAVRHNWDMPVIQYLVFKGYKLEFDTKDCHMHRLCQSSTKNPLDMVIYGDVGRSEKQVERHEEMGAFFIRMGCSRRLLDILHSEMKSRDPAGVILNTILDTFAYLPPLDEVMCRQPPFERSLRRSYATAEAGSGGNERRAKRERYLLRYKTMPSLQHLCRCVIRSSMGSNVRKVTCLPLPGHVKSFILLNQQIPYHIL